MASSNHQYFEGLGLSAKSTLRLLARLLVCCSATVAVCTTPDFGTVRIPRVTAPPRLEDFLTMEPSASVAAGLAKVDGFKQRVPSDGAPVTERTDVYLGYDDRNLYAVFVCFDSNPAEVRARLSRREDLWDDDYVELMLDTFHDHRRAYAFFANPLGIQADSLWNESTGTDDDNFDFSFDTVWDSAGRVTDRGYVVWMAIPFRSMRFASNNPQSWGILLARNIIRKNEKSFWPEYSSRIQGRLNQEGTATGMEHISPGRNLQLIPYGLLRSFKEVDLTDPYNPTYSQRNLFGQIGLDAKVVLKDKFVVDMTANPDFSQIESDQPQVTVNQRFEVFFPETRPFFQENSNFFQTPINLVFTRRIIDPRWGVRMTGKDGPWALGMLVSDTNSPGEQVVPDNPIFEQHAFYAVGRVSRDIGEQSAIGALFADKEVNGFFNRVGAIDARIKINSHWTVNAQGAASTTKNPSDPLFNMFDTTGTDQTGTAAEVIIQRDGRNLSYFSDYADRSVNFRTLTGFDPQPDIRNWYQRLQYTFRPEGSHLISWGPTFETYQTFDHEGNHINSGYFPSLHVELIGQTYLTALYAQEMERLRPQDFDLMGMGIQKYVRHTTNFILDSNYFRRVTLHFDYRFGTRVNYDPPLELGVPEFPLIPFLARRTSMNALVSVRPTRALKIDNTYILFRLRALEGNTGAMNNHIIRSKWNYQFTKAFSFRFIGQYESVLANPAFTSVATAKNFNADFLFTYLVHPSTAVYVGYNSNLANIVSPLMPDGSGDILYDPTGRLKNDGRNLFVKVSYLFRF